jgi:hypothetical protein
LSEARREHRQQVEKMDRAGPGGEGGGDEETFDEEEDEVTFDEEEDEETFDTSGNLPGVCVVCTHVYIYTYVYMYV